MKVNARSLYTVLRKNFKSLLNDMVYRSNYCAVNNKQDTGDNKSLKEHLRVRYSSVITTMTRANILKSEDVILQIINPCYFFTKIANLVQINLNIFQHGMPTYWCYPEDLKLKTRKYMYDLKVNESGEVTLQRCNAYELNIPNSEEQTNAVPGVNGYSETDKIKKSVPIDTDRQSGSVNPSTLDNEPILPTEWYTPEARALMNLEDQEDDILSVLSLPSYNNTEERNTWRMSESLRTEPLSVATSESESANSDTTFSSCNESREVSKKTNASASNVDETGTHLPMEKMNETKKIESDVEDESKKVNNSEIDNETEQDNESAAHNVTIKGSGIQEFLSHVRECVDKSELTDSVSQMKERLKIIEHTMNAWQQIISKGNKMLENFEFTVEDDEPPVLQCNMCILHCSQDYRVAGVRGRPRRQSKKDSNDRK